MVACAIIPKQTKQKAEEGKENKQDSEEKLDRNSTNI